jgi:hypothetical protein
MDRETARRNLGSALLLGSFAAFVFALSFLAAMLYVAQ